MFGKAIFMAFLAVAVLGDEHKLSNIYGNRLTSLFEDECPKNTENFNTLEATLGSIENCVRSFLNMRELREEVKNAKTKADINEIFQKNCEKKPQLKACIHNHMNGFSRCGDASIQGRIASAMNISDEVIDFGCYNNGDNVALLFIEKGLQCYQSKIDDVVDCLGRSQTPPIFIDSKTLSTEEKCTKYDQNSSCVVAVLNTCDTPVAANIFESLFKSIRKASPCNDLVNSKITNY